MSDLRAIRPPFRHRHLAPGNQIRLIKFSDEDSNQSVVTCELIHIDLDELSLAGMTYEALSYTWGSSQNNKTIFVNGFSFAVSENLFNFMEIFQKPLTTNFPPAFTTIPTNRPRYLWIDQICIDQGNRQERNHQVGLMANIYRSAARVIVWLGPATGKTDAIMNPIKRASFMGGQVAASSDATHEAELELATRAYWGRTWIIQEVILARVIQVRCGRGTVSWDFLVDRIAKVQGPYQSTIKDLQAIRSATYAESNRAKRLSWREAALLIRGTCCSNIKDKIYGLNGIVLEDLRLEPDYGKCIEEILADLIEAERKRGSSEESLKVMRKWWVSELGID